MPRIFEHNGYKFYFYVNEGNPPEPCHVHVRKGRCVAKFWMDPEVRRASSWGLSPQELNMLEKIAEQNAERIRREWHEYFGRR